MSSYALLQVSELNDYIGASQTCVKPTLVKKSKINNTNDLITQDSDWIVEKKGSNVYEVSKDTGEEKKLEAAKIDLNDCLACSGCITSAESILVASQSHDDLKKVLAESSKYRLDNPSHPADKFNPQHKLVIVTLSPQSRASFATKYDISPLSVHKRVVSFLSSLGVHHVVDAAFARDFSLLESGREFVNRYREAAAAASSSSSESSSSILPMLASACPGWICYAEKTHGNLMPLISTTKSPQQIMGSIVKTHLATFYYNNTSPDSVYHVSIMPCFDKKLEASRSDFYNDIYRTRDVDTVITTGELERLMREQNVKIADIPEEGNLPTLLSKVDGGILLSTEGTSSGGYLSYIFRYAARELFGIHLTPQDVLQGVPETPFTPTISIPSTTAAGTSPKTYSIEPKPGRNSDYHELHLKLDSQVALRFVTAYGFRNIQNLVRKVGKPSSLKTGNSRVSSARSVRASRANAASSASEGPIHFVEVMACPSGCINGGGQLKPEEVSGDGSKGTVNAPAPRSFVAKAEAVYRSVGDGAESGGWQAPEANQAVLDLYRDWLGGPDTDKASEMLHTKYHAVETEANTTEGESGTTTTLTSLGW